MKTKLSLVWGLAAILLVTTIGLTQAHGMRPQVDAASLSALGTGFTYQGQLKKDGNPVNGTCDFRFILYNAEIGGSQIGSIQNKTAVSVTHGLFTVNLDFGGNAFTGAARWLDIAVRCPAGSGTYTPLTPRQALTPAPYALALPGLWTQQNDTSPNLIGGRFNNTVTVGVYGATIGGGGAASDISTGDPVPNRVTDHYGTVGGGVGNQAGNATGPLTDTMFATVGGGRVNIASGWESVIAGGAWNTASGSYATVAGGAGNVASGRKATVGGGLANTASLTDTTVGGGSGNTASGEAATVAGGGENTASGERATVGGGNTNLAAGNVSFVGGGWNNIASGYSASIGGGDDNTASGGRATIGGGWNNIASDGWLATIGGGGDNTASGDTATIAGGGNNTASGRSAVIGGGENNTASGDHATVGGGSGNTASREWATVGGGNSNTASGWASVVAGGWDNTASGDSSFAAGHRASANHNGAFVWGDTTNADIASSGDNQFLVRSTGGARFVLGINGSGNPTWTCSVANGGSWACSSDRALKENLIAVDGQEVLARVADLPIYAWNAQGVDPSIRHIGPTAQDFYAAFGLGNSATTIATIDLDGVALAAIQALNEMLAEKEDQIAAQQGRIDELEARLSALERARLESGQSPVWLFVGGVFVIGLALGMRRRRGGQP